MNQQTMLQIQNDPRGTIVTIMCREFDFQLTNQFKAEMAGATGGGNAKLPLVLDLTNVGYMPSLTLGALVELRSRFAREQRKLTLAGVQPAIVKLLQVSGMLNLFDIRNNAQEAMSDA